MLRGDAPQGQSGSEITQLGLARVLIVKGDAPSIQRAMALLERLLLAVEAEGRMGVTIEARALQVLAHWLRGEQASAMISLKRAQQLAEPESYVRLFADLGLPTARLLQEAHSRNVIPDYVDKLLKATGCGLSFADFTEKALPEPLSSRKQEVLQLIAAGLTNREIASALVVSPETVKAHWQHLRQVGRPQPHRGRSQSQGT